MKSTCAECNREVKAHWHHQNMIMDEHNVVHRLCCAGCTHRLTGRFLGFPMWVSEDLTQEWIKADV
jgi:hypothetical protein